MPTPIVTIYKFNTKNLYNQYTLEKFLDQFSYSGSNRVPSSGNTIYIDYSASTYSSAFNGEYEFDIELDNIDDIENYREFTYLDVYMYSGSTFSNKYKCLLLKISGTTFTIISSPQMVLGQTVKKINNLFTVKDISDMLNECYINTQIINIYPVLTWENHGDQSYGYEVPQNASSNGVAGVFMYDKTGIQPVGYTVLTATFYPIDTVTYVNGLTVQIAFNINPIPLDVIANDSLRLYGETNSLSLSYVGFILGQTQSDLTTIPTISCSATTTSNVGDYLIVASGGTARNYYFNSYTNGTLTIGKSILTVSGSSTYRYYGDVNPSFTVSYSGFKNGESESVLIIQPTATCSANTFTTVGTYNVVPSGGTATNYSFNYINGILTINKSPLIVTGNSPSRYYGDSNPSFTISSITGFKNGETSTVLMTQPTASCSVISTTTVGTYNVIPSGGTATNYSFSYVNGTLTINKSILTVTANNKTRTYNVPNPTLTISYSGFKNGETESVLLIQPYCTCSAIPTTNVGTVDIIPAGGVATNYSFNYVNGTLTITKATPTIIWNNPSSIFTDIPLSSTQLNATISPVGVPGSFSYSPSATTLLSVGSHTLSTTFTSSSGNWNNNTANVNIYVSDVSTISITIRPLEGYGFTNWAVNGTLYVVEQSTSNVLATIYYSNAIKHGTYDLDQKYTNTIIGKHYHLDMTQLTWTLQDDDPATASYRWNVNDFEISGTGNITGNYLAHNGDTWTIEFTLSF